MPGSTADLNIFILFIVFSKLRMDIYRKVMAKENDLDIIEKFTSVGIEGEVSLTPIL